MVKMTSFKLWNILQDITSKKDWYEKVFDEVIIAKWRAEIASQNCQHDFTLAIRILQSTAKGVQHTCDGSYYGCEWPDVPEECTICIEVFRALVLKDPEEITACYGNLNVEEIDDFYQWAHDNCNHIQCNCIPPESNLNNYIECSTMSKDIHNTCLSIVKRMCKEEPIDWHPGSNNTVRDIIHPSLYCLSQPKKIEQERYQWLPSEFEVSDTCNVKVKSYINNLNSDKYPEFIPMVETMFSSFIPSLERVTSSTLRGKNLQVIIKVGSTILTRNSPSFEGGSWHIEGMPYENIVATALTYLEVDGITDSFLEFRKPVIINDEAITYPQSDDKFTSHHYGIEREKHHEGTMNRYLGLIKCEQGNSVVFPNSLQHRVKEFKLQKKRKHGERTIICFFLVDPNVRITSTADIPPQQGVMPLEEAHRNRGELMYHRKFFVDSLNKKVFEREFSLCEH
jgi:hypothetical protein